MVQFRKDTLMRIYIEAYYADGSQILGNCDGQACITAKRYKRTNAYKRAYSIVYERKTRVSFMRVVDERGLLLEQIGPSLNKGGFTNGN